MGVGKHIGLSGVESIGRKGKREIYSKKRRKFIMGLPATVFDQFGKYFFVSNFLTGGATAPLAPPSDGTGLAISYERSIRRQGHETTRKMRVDVI